MTLTAGNQSVPPVGLPGSPDDRWVFTEDNPDRELLVCAGLAVTSRALKGYNDALSQECLQIAQELWTNTKEKNRLQRVKPAVELLLATNDKKYADFLVSMTDEISKNISRTGWVVGRTLPLINNKKYRTAITNAVKGYKATVDQQEKKPPTDYPINRISGELAGVFKALG